MAAPGDLSIKFNVEACQFCNRKFIPASLEKHEKICENTFVNKRKVFDSHKQRTDNTPLAKVVIETNKHQTPRQLKSKWREKHEDFINTIRVARGIAVAEKLGIPLPPMRTSKIPSDYIPCPHCSRHFSIKAADRHIEWCKEQKSRIGQPTNKVASEAKIRLEARTKYRVPTLRKKPNENCVKPPKCSSIISVPIRAASTSKSIGAQPQRLKESEKSKLSDTLLSRKGRTKQNTTTPSPPVAKIKATSRASPVPKPNHPNGSTEKKQIQQNGPYDPYMAAELQYRDLLDSEVNVRSRPSKIKQQLKPRYPKSATNLHRNHMPAASNSTVASMTSLESDRTWVSHDNAPLCQRPTKSMMLEPMLLRRSTNQVRDIKECGRNGSRTSWHGYAPIMDDNRDVGERYERGSGDLCYVRAPEKLHRENRSSAARHKQSRNGSCHHHNNNNMPSMEAVDSYNGRRNRRAKAQIDPSLRNPPLGQSMMLLRKWTSPKNHCGQCDAPTFDQDQPVLSTSSSDSSLPRLLQRSRSYASDTSSSCYRSNHHDSDAESGSVATFCHECGTAYFSATAKFCCECGQRRLYLA